MSVGRSLPCRFGSYELLRQLGEGGMGVVFAGRDADGRDVALKVLHERKADNMTALRRFEREVEMLSRLGHPNVCAVLDAGDVEGVLYFTMELVRGSSLEKLIEEEGGGLPWRRACSIVRDTARGLAHAHECGVVHRDVKPANVLVAEDGTAKLVDFGLALHDEDELDRLTRTGALLGTPAYMAPERYDKKIGSSAGTPADIYALGITLYEAIAGWPPFDGESLYEVVKLVRAGDAPPLEVPEDAPHELAPLVHRMIARDPAARPATADEVVRALDAMLAAPEGAGSAATRSSSSGGDRSLRGPLRSAGGWIREHPAGFLAACALAPILPALVLAGAFEGTPPAPPVVPPPPPPIQRPAAAADLVKSARERVFAGDLEAARALYDRALALSPGNDDALSERALVAVVLVDLDAMLADRQLLAGREQRTPVARVVLAVGSSSFGFAHDPGPRDAEERAHPLAPFLTLIRAQSLLPTQSESATLVREAFAAHPDCGLLATFLAATLGLEGRLEDGLALLEQPRSYEGIATVYRDSVRATTLERLGRIVDAEKVYARIERPIDQVVHARGRLACLALDRGELERAIEVYGSSEPGLLEDRVRLALAHSLLGHTAQARAVADAAVELAEDEGDLGAIAHACGAGRGVHDAYRAFHASRRDDPTVRAVVAHVLGFRARLAARASDIARARNDLLKLDAESAESLATNGVVRIARGDFEGAMVAFAQCVSGTAEGGLPRDALLDAGTALERSGQSSSARELYRKIAEHDAALGRVAKERIARLEAEPAVPATERVLLEVRPSKDAMTGGADGQGPRLLTAARWGGAEQETIYGYAPTIFIPESAADRVVEIAVESEEPLSIQVLAGSAPRDDHKWWLDGHAPVAQSEKAVPSPRLSWVAKPGTWTILVARVLPKDKEPEPCPLGGVKVTLHAASTR